MKEIITQMITEYLPVILTAVMTAIVGFVKSKYTKIANDSIKKDVASRETRVPNQNTTTTIPAHTSVKVYGSCPSWLKK